MKTSDRSTIGGIAKRQMLACALLAGWVLALGWTLTPWHRPPPQDAALQVSQPPAGLRATPAGIVNLELAMTPARAQAIVDAWRSQRSPACTTARQGADGPLTDCAWRSLGLDWVLIAIYGGVGWLVFRSILWGLGVAPHRFWRLLRWAPVVAGLADLGENLGLAVILGTAGTSAGWVVLFTGALALVKLALLGATLVAAVLVLGFFAFHRAVRRGAGPKEAPPYLLGEDQVLANEMVYLEGRRGKAGLSGLAGPPVGLALSGGGIRSATISLGAIQVLGRSGFGAYIDYLSTVSGGGYIGSALTSLLSCRERHRGDRPSDRAQFVFGPGERPHFDLARPADAPFEDTPDPAPPPEHRDWLSGRIVVAHLRAFGDYLVRRRRLIDRDVLRALGTVLSGVAMSLVLFAVVLAIVAALALAAISVAGGEVIPGVDGPIAYLGVLVSGAAGTLGLALAAGLGAIYAVTATVLAGYCADLTPVDWFRRDGDTPEDARQRRALWLLAGLSLLAALLTPVFLGSQLVDLANTLALPVAFLAGALVATVLLYLLLATRLLENRLPFEISTRSYHGAVIALFLYLVLLALGLVAITLALGWLTKGDGAPTLTEGMEGGGAVAIGALVSGLVAWWRAQRGAAKETLGEVRSWYERSTDAIQRIILGLGVAVVLVGGLALSMAGVEIVLTHLLGSIPVTRQYLVMGAVAAALVWLFTRLLNFNRLSLHYFYRDRLIEAYLTTLASPPEGARGAPEVRRDQGSLRLADVHGRQELPFGAGPPATFKQYRWDDRTTGTGREGPGIVEEGFPGAATSAPYHLCCTCLNLATDRDSAYRSRKSDIFLFSRLYCGSRSTGFVDTGAYRSGETKLARAMTISGAAADSAVGRETFFAQSFASTLFNIRLGQWLENPAYRRGTEVWRQERGVFWPWYLWMEAFGMSDRRHRLIHLSDGGHSGDNLGLVPLFRRRCRLILAIDGEQDPSFGFGSLMHALQYVEADLCIRVDLSLDGLQPNDKGLVARHHAVGTIHYPQTRRLAASTGVLVVLKSSVKAENDETILKHRAAHPEFPHETTLDQFFAEEQFEAYRRLGQAMAAGLLGAHPELEKGYVRLPPNV